MKTDIIQPDGDLKREVWSFELFNFKPEIRLMYYSFQTRPSTRHKKWITQSHWDRLDQRYNSFAEPPISVQAIYDAKEYFIQQIKNAEVIT